MYEDEVIEEIDEEAEKKKYKGSFFIGFVLGLFFSFIGLMFGFMIAKKRTIAGSAVGFAVNITAVFGLYVLINAYL